MEGPVRIEFIIFINCPVRSLHYDRRSVNNDSAKFNIFTKFILSLTQDNNSWVHGMEIEFDIWSVNPHSTEEKVTHFHSGLLTADFAAF